MTKGRKHIFFQGDVIEINVKELTQNIAQIENRNIISGAMNYEKWR